MMRRQTAAEMPDRGGEPRDDAAWLTEALAAGGASAWTWAADQAAVVLGPGAGDLLEGTPATIEALQAQVHPDDRAARTAALGDALARGGRWVTTFRPRPTSDRWIEERGRAWLGEDERPARIAALLVDVTSRREMEQVLERRLRAESQERRAAEVATGTAEAARAALARSEALLESMFAAMADGLVLCDAAGHVTRMNPAAREMLRWEPRRSSSGAWFEHLEVLDVEGRPLPRERLPVALALRGETVKGLPLCFQGPDGRKVWATVGAAPLRAPEGAVVGAVMTLGDVSRLRDLQEQREDLSRMIAHDLRTPLGVILAQAKLLGRRAESPDAIRGRAEAIVTSAQRMASMLNDLVESALLEAGKLRLELGPVRIPEVVRELTRRLGAPFDAGRIRVEEGVDIPPVLGDVNRLERVIVNLLTNALKYSAPGSDVLVRFAAADDHVELSVVDRGQGIAAEDVPHLFERFFRASGSARLEGMGLGLYTARMLVEAHRGTIEVSSVAGEGSTFVVRLPTGPPAA